MLHQVWSGLGWPSGQKLSAMKDCMHAQGGEVISDKLGQGAGHAAPVNHASQRPQHPESLHRTTTADWSNRTHGWVTCPK
jgi:hypothetical protein